MESWYYTALAIDPDGNTSELSACYCPQDLFADGFESGNTSAWSAVQQ